MDFQIHLIERNKNFKVRNVCIMAKMTHDEYIKNSIKEAIKEIGFFGRFSPYFKEEIIKKITRNINKIYEYSLTHEKMMKIKNI